MVSSRVVMGGAGVGSERREVRGESLAAWVRWAALLAITLLAGVPTAAVGVNWLLPPDHLVASSANFRDAQIGDGCWQAVIEDPADPIIVLQPVRVDARRQRHLYVTLAAPTLQSVQVFFSGNGGFTEAMSFRSDEVESGDRPVTYRFDLDQLPRWTGEITSLRIDLDGCDRGVTARLWRVGVSEQPVSRIDGTPVVAVPVSDHPRAYNERMAAHHQAIVAVDERRPNAALLTYVNDHFTYTDLYLLAKLVAGVEVAGQTHWPAEARARRVTDLPGAVEASYQLGKVRVTTRITPLLVGRREAPNWEGAALYTVRTEPPTPVAVRCGGGDVISFQQPRRYLRQDEVGAEGDTVAALGQAALLRSSRQPLSVGVVTNGLLSVQPGAAGGQCAGVRFPGGQGRLVLGFAKDPSRAGELAQLDGSAGERAVHEYYRRLLASRIETPEPVMDQAFRTAALTLEYNWLAPYGWTECIHHWLAMWHMQHTAGEEWLGHADRSRLCNLTTAAHLLPNGAVPQFTPDGHTRRDFGGSNQFFAWQLRHYWQFTGDRATIERLAPALDAAVAQTFAEYDPDGNGLLAWGQQIGNQEDYVSTPYDGTSPSVEGINMLRTQAMVERVLRHWDKAGALEARAGEAAARLRAELWQPDLGWFAFYRDPLGVSRPDGQYHSQIYPVIWGLTDALDSWTSMDHLRARMMGADGEVYCSNNFPNHVGGTWGMQAGAAQQPWGAMGLAAVGLRNETWRPLRAVAQWVMNDDHRGSWPEIARESGASYFSPPAGLYISSTVEALFGLQVNRPAGVLTVAPSFPDHWPSARLTLPAYTAEYRRQGNTLTYTVTSETPLVRHLRWRLPPGGFTVTVDGRQMRPTVSPQVGCALVALDTAASRRTTFQVTMRPVTYRLGHARAIAEGEPLIVRAAGCRLVQVDDRCGVLGSSRLATDSVQAAVRTGLLRPYLPYGRLGQLNFSRRTFFLRCQGGGADWWEPVTVTVLPRYEAAVVGEVTATGLQLLVRNNTGRPVRGKAHLLVGKLDLPLFVDLPAYGEQVCRVPLSPDLPAILSPGANRASLALPGAVVDLTLPAGQVYEQTPELAADAAARTQALPLPEELLQDDTRWRDWRHYYAYGHQPWASSRPPLEALGEKTELTVPGLPGVRFALSGRRLVPISRRVGRPTFSLDLQGVRYRKLYLLVVPFLDNHDTFSPVARVEVQTANRGLYARTLHFPGDLDWWCPQAVVWDFETAREPRPDSYGLLPLLKPDQADWPEGRPPVFPQPRYWATCPAVRTDSAVLNVVEVDLGRAQPAERLTINLLSADAALGLVAVCGERAGGTTLAGTPYQPAARYREPRPLFGLDTLGNAEGWRLEGDAFSVAPVPHLFTFPTLNSLAKNGERVTGRAISPAFTIAPEERFLDWRFQGGRSDAERGPGALYLELVDAGTGEVLAHLAPPVSHTPLEARLDVSRWQGRTVRLEIVDENTGDAYAWVGLLHVALATQ